MRIGRFDKKLDAHHIGSREAVGNSNPLYRRRVSRDEGKSWLQKFDDTDVIDSMHSIDSVSEDMPSAEYKSLVDYWNSFLTAFSLMIRRQPISEMETSQPLREELEATANDWRAFALSVNPKKEYQDQVGHFMGDVRGLIDRTCNLVDEKIKEVKPVKARKEKAQTAKNNKKVARQEYKEAYAKLPGELASIRAEYEPLIRMAEKGHERDELVFMRDKKEKVAYERVAALRRKVGKTTAEWNKFVADGETVEALDAKLAVIDSKWVEEADKLESDLQVVGARFVNIVICFFPSSADQKRDKDKTNSSDGNFIGKAVSLYKERDESRDVDVENDRQGVRANNFDPEESLIAQELKNLKKKAVKEENKLQQMDKEKNQNETRTRRRHDDRKSDDDSR